MSTLTQDQLERLVTKAALDRDFREKLKSSPQEAVAVSIDLDQDDLNVLKILASDLQRLARTSLEPVDAKSWAVGICHIRTHPPGGGQ